MFFGISAHSEELTTQALYERFNMRSIYSSYGQRLKYDCKNSYPVDVFSVTSQTEDTLELRDGDNIWVFYLLDGNTISLHNQITSGTYLTESTYELKFDPEAQDWRAGENLIEFPDDCVENDSSNLRS